MNPQRKFLQILRQTDPGPFLSHCQRFELPHREAGCFFLPLRLREQMARSCEQLVAQLARLVTQEVSSLAQMGLPLGLAEVACQDGPQDLKRCAWRLDLAWDGRGESFFVLECNAADPSGLAWSESLAQGVWHSQAMQRLRQHWHIEASWLLPAFVKLLPAEPVLCVCPSWSFVAGDHRAMVTLLRASGRSAHYWDPACPPPCLPPWGTIYRDALDELYLHYPQAWERLLRAPAEGVALVNPLHAQAAEPKAWLAELSRLRDPECLAWTRTLDQWEGPLPEDPAPWVLKPGLGYGGEGVILGRLSSPRRWSDHLQKASRTPRAYVLQRHCPLARWRGLPTTLSVWIISGRFAGMFARAHRHPVTNVKRGALLLPVFYYGDRAKS